MSDSTSSSSEPAEKTNPLIRPIPGAEVVGRGIYLRPRLPYELKRQLLAKGVSSKYYCAETCRTFEVPHGTEVNNSPPMPAQNAINQLIIEKSWERLDKHLSFDANLASGNLPFSIDVNSSQASQLRTEEDAYYALRNSFVPLFSVYVPDVTKMAALELKDIKRLPAPFRHRHRAEYERFFEKYGTHYVKRAWVGGKATLAFTILKSSNMRTDEVKKAIKASFAPVGEASVDQASKDSKEQLQSNSECTVWGKGGNAISLAALGSLDDAGYVTWLKSVENNPEAIELEVAGIWTLISEEQEAAANEATEPAEKGETKPSRPDNVGKPTRAQALVDAYKAASTFTPLSTIFSAGNIVFFMRNEKCQLYDLEEGKSHLPFKIAKAWPDLPKYGFGRIDAAFGRAASQSVSRSASKSNEEFTTVYVFCKNECMVLKVTTQKAKTNEEATERPGSNEEATERSTFEWPKIEVIGYPQRLADAWPGVGFDRIDAVLDAGGEDLYLFRGTQYVRFDMNENKVCVGYPQDIKDRWVGVTFDRIDAALYSPHNGKAYFFREDQHVRYDMVSYRTDPGYPKFIPGSYVEDWKFF